MRSSHISRYVLRPKHILMGMLSTWIFARLYEASEASIFYAPLVTGLLVFGTSIFYFGIENDMYIRKNKSLAVSLLTRKILIVLGLISLAYATYITQTQLNMACLLIVFLDVVIILLYPRKLSSHWSTKNMPMALVCISPIIIGIVVGNYVDSRAIICAMVGFFSYLVKEIINDAHDVRVDRGRRKTLPICFGVSLTRHIGFVIMLFDIIFVGWFICNIGLDKWYTIVFSVVTLVYFSLVLYSLGFKPSGQEETESNRVIYGSAFFIISVSLLII